MTARHAFLLAGGRGTRLRPLTAHAPKPMLPFLTEPVIGGWLRRLVDAGIADVHLLVAADPRPFADAVSTARHLGLRVTVHTESSPLHSGGALRAAVDAHHEQVLVINADIVTDAPIDGLVAEHDARAADATILAVLHERPSEYGVMRLGGDRLVAFDEKPAGRDGREWVNAGVYVLAASVLDRLPPTGPCDLEADVFPILAASDAEMFVSRWPGGWADLGTPERYLDAHRAALDGRLPWPTPPGIAPFAPGVLCHRDARVDRHAVLRPPTIIGAGARIGARAVIGPYATLGRYATVSRGCQVRDSVVLDHTQLPAGTRTRGTIVGPHATVNVDHDGTSPTRPPPGEHFPYLGRSPAVPAS